MIDNIQFRVSIGCFQQAGSTHSTKHSNVTNTRYKTYMCFLIGFLILNICTQQLQSMIGNIPTGWKSSTYIDSNLKLNNHFNNKHMVNQIHPSWKMGGTLEYKYCNWIKKTGYWTKTFLRSGQMRKVFQLTGT